LKKWLKSITTKSKRSVIRKRKKLPKYNTKPVATSDWFFDDSVCWKKSGLILNKILTDCYATRDKTEAERSAAWRTIKLLEWISGVASSASLPAIQIGIAKGKVEVCFE
jgi:hypothetical protein